MTEKMAEKETKKSPSILGGLALLVILLSLTLWMYEQFTVNDRNWREAYRMSQDLLKHQTELAREYSKEMALIRESLNKTEALLGKVRNENLALQEKVKLLDRLTNMEETITRLKEKNAHLINQMSTMEWKTPRMKTVDDGKSLLGKYRDKVREIKQQMSRLRHQEREKQIAAQKEKDRIQMLLGNNGYAVRDGAMTLVEKPEPKNIQVDVTFVK